MDPLDTTPKIDVFDASKLKLWQHISPNMLPETYINQEKIFDENPFKFNPEINKKIALWAGDITLLSCHCITNTTNENLTDKSSSCQRILKKGGPQLKQAMKDLRICRTGDAKLTKAYGLPARYVIHTVGPKYNQKYHTAAESALYSCYSKTLQLAREYEIKSIALCAINSVRRGYPPHSGANLALRIVRRFLENHGNEFEIIVFAVEDVDIGIYELLMPLYFPRSEKEEEYGTYYLPKDVGGERGEPVIPERKIRIADKPLLVHQSPEMEETVDLSSGLDASVAVGQSTFAKMQGDIDKRWSSPQSTRKPNDALTTEAQRKNRYERLLRKSRQEDLSEMAYLRCLYVTGEDRMGRPVVVFIGKRFDTNTVDLDKALLYFIHTLDPIVQKEYVVIYFHSTTNSNNHPSLNFVREVYETLDYKYKKNLKALYMVHPSFWCRLLTWWFTTFTASSLKDKICCIGGVEYLDHVIPLDQLQVPSFIMDYDFKVNGVRYFQPPQSSDSL